MNFRPWYKRLLLNPFSFTFDILMLAYEKHHFTNPTLMFGSRLTDLNLEFDAGRGQLNGIPFGAGIDRLKPLGAADCALSSEGESGFSLEYSALGLDISFEEQRLVSFEISFDSMHGGEHPTRFVPCKRTTIKTDEVRTFDLGYSSSPDDVNGMLGDPAQVETCKYRFGIERVLFYNLPACRVVASFDAGSNRLIHLDLSATRA